jgi:hypothetical protein
MAVAENLREKLSAAAKAMPLPGISGDHARQTLVRQMVDSLRRIQFAHYVRDEQFDTARADPTSIAFDPLRAAMFWARKGEIDEAIWLVFLFVHFGKHPKDGYRLVRDVYGALGGKAPWTWDRVSKNTGGFRQWLDQNLKTLRAPPRRRFGNHRKYESLSGTSNAGTGAVVESFAHWLAPSSSLGTMVKEIHKKVGQDPRAVFDALYRSMDEVHRFGRLAKFDFLTMLAKLGLAPIEAGSAYLPGATGPLTGARLLFAGDPNAALSPSSLDKKLLELDEHLGVGMQVLEDSLCNWQKSPIKYIHFRG